MDRKVSYNIVTFYALLALLSSSVLFADLSDGLVGHWSFDDGTATDNSGNGNNGTIHGAIATGGVSGQALHFDGLNDYVRVPDTPSLNFGPNQDFSLLAWIKAEPGQTNYQGTILAKLNPEDGNIKKRSLGYALMVRGIRDPNYEGQAGVWIGGEHGEAELFKLYSDNDYDDGAWHHVAATVDRDGLGILYVDGREVDSADISHLSSVDQSYPENLEIGREGVLNTYHYRGVLDDIRIYNRELSCWEIRSLYEQVFNIADFSRDGSVDTVDLATLTGEWLNTEGVTADISPECGDEIVNLVDFAGLAANWFD